VHSEKDEGLGTLKAGFVRIERRKSYSCEEEAIIALLPHSDFIVVSQGSNARTGRLGMVARQEGDDGGRGGGHHLRQVRMVSFLLLYFCGDFAVGYVVAGIILLTAGDQSCYVFESKSLGLCI
jgi:hypothetical protein